jgi:hypothetical protein
MTVCFGPLSIEERVQKILSQTPLIGMEIGDNYSAWEIMTDATVWTRQWLQGHKEAARVNLNWRGSFSASKSAHLLIGMEIGDNYSAWEIMTDGPKQTVMMTFPS